MLKNWICAGLVLVGGAAPIFAGATCIEAVFFDLGDTLVEAGGGGLFVVRDGVDETLTELQARGVQLGIITNVPAGWTIANLQAVLEQPELLDEFDVVVLSSQAPASKPNPAIYTFAHNLLPSPVAITATAFVGETLAEIADTEVAPTQGARSVGMVGIHLSNAAPSPLADFTIATNDLQAVVDIVDTTCFVFADGFELGDTSGWSATVP
jgi:ribonucleotide monophosphatase NagD (HAD superfamily)